MNTRELIAYCRNLLNQGLTAEAKVFIEKHSKNVLFLQCIKLEAEFVNVATSEDIVNSLHGAANESDPIIQGVLAESVSEEILYRLKNNEDC